jgi:membrane protein
MLVFGQPIGDAVRDDFPMGGAFVLVWTAVRWAVAIVSVMVLFAAFYYLAPNRDSPKWAWVSPGGVVAAVVWLAASVGFSFYVSSFGSYAETYGSLAGVVVLLLWLFLSALAVMAGGELNAELERQSAMKAGQLPTQGQLAGGRGGRGAVADRPGEPAGRAGNGNARDGAAGSPEAVREWARRMREVRESSNR